MLKYVIKNTFTFKKLIICDSLTHFSQKQNVFCINLFCRIATILTFAIYYKILIKKKIKLALNRYYWPTKFSSRKDFLEQGVKCVFISHQQKDKEQAVQIADYLIAVGISVYIDAYDQDLKIHHQANNAKAVTDSIRKGINNSSHMLVIVSIDTLFSTWVPFEIGYGFDKTDLLTLCLKGIQKGGLPEYLKSTKIIRDIYDLNILIENIRGVKKEILLESKVIKDYNDNLNPLNNIMDNFINETY